MLPWTTTHCGPCKTCTCGVDWLPVPDLQSGAFAARPTTHETRERPELGDEYRTSLPRVSSDGRTRTYNPTINSRLRCQLRHAGMIKRYAVFHASARMESNHHHPLRRRVLCPLSYRRLNWPHHSWRRRSLMRVIVSCYPLARNSTHFRAASRTRASGYIGLPNTNSVTPHNQPSQLRHE